MEARIGTPVMLPSGIRGRHVTVPQNVESSRAGHIGYAWHQHGHTYAVTIHGHTPTARRILLLMLRHTVLVKP